MVFGYRKNDRNLGAKKVVSYRPNFLIIIGASINIIFASIFSVLLITVVITIPTIVFNAMLFHPKISNKRYIGVTRVIPVILSLGISLFLLLIAVYGSDAVLNIYNGVADFVNTLTFWDSNGIMSRFNNEEQINLWIKIIFIIFAFGGNLFILVGWFKGRTLIEINNDNFNQTNLHKKGKRKKY